MQHTAGNSLLAITPTATGAPITVTPITVTPITVTPITIASSASSAITPIITLAYDLARALQYLYHNDSPIFDPISTAWYNFGMKLPQRLSLHAGFWLVLLLSIFAWAPATYPGYWQALEGFTPVFNASNSSLLANVAVQPDVWRGMGGGTFLLIRPFLLFGFTPTAAVRFGFILTFLLGGLGSYSWLQAYLGDRAAGLAGLIYLYSPPLLATVYIRGSLSDAVVIALLPLALAGLSAYCRSRALSAAGIAVIAIVWMWQTQAGLALFATILLLCYVLFVERHWMAILIVLVSAAASLVSLAPIINVNAPASVVFTDHFVYLFQLFQHQWQSAPSIAGWQDGYPFQLGVPAIIYTLVALWGLGAWRLSTQDKPPLIELQTDKQQDLHDRLVVRLWLFSLAGLLVIIGLTLPVSEPFWRWSNAQRLLTYPWQLLLLTLPLLAVTAGSVPTFTRLFRQTPSWVVLAALAVLGNFPYLTADFTQIVPSATPVALFGTRSEIVILDAAVTENRQPRFTELAITWQILHPLAVDYNIFFQVLRSDGQALSVIRQLDVQPLGDEEPATSWQPGKIYQSTYRLDLEDIPPDAMLRYYFGYYDWRDGSRLPVNWDVDDKLIFYGQ